MALAAVPFGGGPSSVIVADFDEDGQNDVAVVNFHWDSVSILLGNGNGSFQDQTEFPTGGSPSNLSVGDFNGDGNRDLVVANYGGGNGSTVSVLLGNGDGTFQTKTSYATGRGPESVKIADFNADGISDLAVANVRDGTVSVLFGNGNGSFQTRFDYVVGDAPAAMTIVDLNDDSIDDLAVANQGEETVAVLLGNNDGTFQPLMNFGVGGVPCWMVDGDFNGDGDIDLAVVNAGDDTVSILLGNGDGTFQTQMTYATGHEPRSIAAGDFDGDTRIDLAIAHYGENVIHVLQGNGDGSFQTRLTLVAEDVPAFIAIADVNSDGRKDVLVANADSNTVSVFLNTTGNTPADSTPPSVGSILRSGSSPTNGDLVEFTVNFSEEVSEVSADDFTLDVSGISGASITDVSGSGATYTVTVATGSGDGTLSIDFTGDVIDAAGNHSTQPFTNGESYLIQKNANIAVAVSTTSVIEDGTTNLIYAFTRDGSTANPLTISFSVSGTAIFPTDYQQNGASSFSSTSGTVTFASDSSIAIITIDPIADGRIEADESVVLTVVAEAGYVVGETAVATGTIANDDIAGFSITQPTGVLSVGEDGSTAQFSVRLTAQPTSHVVLTVTSSDATEAGVGPGTLTFTPENWDVPQAVTVTGVDDEVVDGGQSSTVTIGVQAEGSDDAFGAVSSRAVSITTSDDDFFGFRVLQSGGPTTVNESTTTDTFQVVLSAQPNSNVVLDLKSGDTGEATMNKSRLTFTRSNWNVPQTVTVKGVNDDFVDGSQISNVTIRVNASSSENRFDRFPAQTVSVTTTDNDVAGFRIVESGGQTSVNESGTTDTFTVVLTARPLSNIVLNVASGNTSEATVTPVTLTFTSSNWNRPQTVTARGVNDEVIDGDQTSFVTISVDDARSENAFDDLADQTVAVTTVDNDISDFGDAPATYGTLLPNGARHPVSMTGPKLGREWDGEIDGQLSVDGTGDGDDEDGVFFAVNLLRRTSQAAASSVFVSASKSAKLDAWIDFNQDGDFEDAGERIATSKSVAAGVRVLPFSVPSTAELGGTFARFRISTAGVASSTGSAADGEVEDYAVTILNGDVPRRLTVDLPIGAPAITVSTASGSLAVKSGSTLLTRVSANQVTSLEINGSSGNDKVTLAALPTDLSGRVTVDGGAGNDSLSGTSAGVRIRLIGDSGNDTLVGGTGGDTLLGEEGDDSLKGNNGDDILLGGSGKDKLFGDAGNDALVGDDGNDSLDGGADRDTLLGLSGNDTLKGGNGNDLVLGGDGDDSVNGGTGTDTLAGNAGSNRFDVSGERNELFSFDIDQILDRL